MTAGRRTAGDMRRAAVQQGREAQEREQAYERALVERIKAERLAEEAAMPAARARQTAAQRRLLVLPIPWLVGVGIGPGVKLLKIDTLPPARRSGAYLPVPVAERLARAWEARRERERYASVDRLVDAWTARDGL